MNTISVLGILLVSCTLLLPTSSLADGGKGGLRMDYSKLEKDLSIKHALSVATDVDLYKADTKAPPYVVFSVVKIGDNVKLFKAFEAIHSFHDRPYSKNYEYDIGIPFTGMKGQADFKYSLTTGELGSNDQWCYAPKEFRTRMLKMDKLVSKMPPPTNRKVLDGYIESYSHLIKIVF